MGPRQRPRLAALSGSLFLKAPGFAGEYLRITRLFTLSSEKEATSEN